MSQQESVGLDTQVDVLVIENIWGEPFDSLSREFTVRYEPDLWSDKKALFRECKSTRAIVVRNRAQVTEDLIAASPNLQIIARAGVGLDNIDIDAAEKLGVVVVAALGANAQSVGEHALAMGFALARDVAGNDARTRQGQWDRRQGMELAGRTWGAIGLGATGRVTVRLAQAIGMEVIGYDPYLSPSNKIEGLTSRVDTVQEILETAQFISLHLPLTEETFGLVDATFLNSMRPDAYLINSSRGGLVDEDALADALDAGKLAGAALDVRIDEPPRGHRLNQHDQVVLSPHVAGVTKESQRRVTEILAEELSLLLRGESSTRSVGLSKISRKKLVK